MFIEQGGDLQGCIIFRTNTRFGLKEVVLCEFLLAEPRMDLCRDLLARLRSSLKADYLITHFPEGSFHRRGLEQMGFRGVPGQGMNFTVRPLVQDLPQDPLQFSNWGLAMGDLELF